MISQFKESKVRTFEPSDEQRFNRQLQPCEPMLPPLCPAGGSRSPPMGSAVVEHAVMFRVPPFLLIASQDQRSKNGTVDFPPLKSHWMRLQTSRESRNHPIICPTHPDWFSCTGEATEGSSHFTDCSTQQSCYVKETIEQERKRWCQRTERQRRGRGRSGMRRGRSGTDRRRRQCELIQSRMEIKRRKTEKINLAGLERKKRSTPRNKVPPTGWLLLLLLLQLLYGVWLKAMTPPSALMK